MKYLILGNGYLGNKFNNFLDDSVIDKADINDESAVKAAITKYQPEVLINCAAKSGRPNIDWCEDHKLETLNANLRGPLTLLKITQEMGIFLVQLGSGCVYEGDNNGRGFAEDDPANFDGSYYSRLKAVMNDVLKEYPVLQLRLRMPLDAEPGPRNFITKITSYKQVISVPNSITVIDDLLMAAKVLMEKRKVGVYNIVNPGGIEHKEILDLYKEIVDPEFEYSIISLDDLHQLTKARRSNCILDGEKLAAEGIAMPPIKERLRDILREYKRQL